MMTNNLTSVLNELIRTAKDGEHGFRNAAAHVQEQELIDIFLEKAQGCQLAAHELQKKVIDLDYLPETIGSLLGALHRGWINVKTAVSDTDAHSVLVECERGEAAARKIYAQALDMDAPEDIRTLIKHQYDGVVTNQHQIQDLCDRYAVKHK